MKTVLLNASPKKRFSASAYFVWLQRLFIRGSVVKQDLRTPGDHENVLEQLSDADNLVIALPLYVDGVPAHVLSFLKKAEEDFKGRKTPLNLYAISNGGFIEGVQSEPLFRVLENFARRANCEWKGGVGIGGGVMLNVMRIVIMVQCALFAINLLLSGMQTGTWFALPMLWEFLSGVAVPLLLQAGVFVYLAAMGGKISRLQANGNRYTRILLPSFVFILFADIFFTVMSLMKGGLFKGWFNRK